MAVIGSPPPKVHGHAGVPLGAAAWDGHSATPAHDHTPAFRNGRAPFDDVNLGILGILLQRGRSTMREIATAVNRTESTVRERVATLEQHGIVTGYEARIDWALAGYSLTAVVEGNCDPSRPLEVAAHLHKVANVVSAIFTTGFPNVLTIVRARDMQDLRKTMALLRGSTLLDITVRISLDELVAERQLLLAAPFPRMHTGIHPALATPPHARALLSHLQDTPAAHAST